MNTLELTFYPHPTHVTWLDSGFCVMTVRTPSKFARLALAVRYGGMHCEPAGSAHVLEHLLYEGPARNGVHPLLAPLVPFGVKGNACTSSAFTSYLASGHMRSAEKMLAALLVMAFEQSFTSKMVDAERSVIQRETLRTHLSDKLYSWEMRCKYPNRPLMSNPTIGTAESLSEASFLGLVASHQNAYVAENTALIVVGDVAHERILEQVHDYPFPRGNAVASDPLFPKYVDASTTCVHKPPRLIRYFHEPTDEREQTLLDMALAVLVESPFGVLYRKLRLEQNLVYHVSADSDAWPRHEVSITVEIEPEWFEHVDAEIDRAIEMVCEGEIPADALAADRSDRLLNHEVSYWETAGADWYEQQLNDWIGGYLTNVDHERIIRTAREEDLAAVARTYLGSGHGTLRIIQTT